MKPTYGGTLVFSCTTIIQIHHLSVKFLKVSHYIRNFKEPFSTETKKDPSTGQDIQERFINGFRKQSSYPSRKNIHIRTLHRRISFQVVAGEKHFLSIVLLRWQPTKPNFLCVLRLQFSKCFSKWQPMGLAFWGVPTEKISPSGSRRERQFQKRFKKNLQKNNSAQVGQNFENQLPDNLSGIKKQTSDQVGWKLESHF